MQITYCYLVLFMSFFSFYELSARFAHFFIYKINCAETSKELRKDINNITGNSLYYVLITFTRFSSFI